jgi:hypothetical protein
MNIMAAAASHLQYNAKSRRLMGVVDGRDAFSVRQHSGDEPRAK